jgi:hypothetical protein
MDDYNDIAAALHIAFTNESIVADTHDGPANVVDALYKISFALESVARAVEQAAGIRTA